MLTKKQKELYDYLCDYVIKNQISPSFEEMKNAVNLKSKSGIHRLITSLEQRGFIKRLKHKARAMEIVKKNESTSNESSTYLEIPLLGSIAAGDPIEAIENPDQHIAVPANFISPNNQYFGLKVKGDSMIEAGIHDCDTVIIKKTSTADTGQIAVVLIDEQEATLKKIRKKGNTIALEAANKNYDTKIYASNRIKIQGRLISLYRNFH